MDFKHTLQPSGFESTGMAQFCEKLLTKVTDRPAGQPKYKDLFKKRAWESRYFVNPLHDVRSCGERSYTSGQDK